MGRYWFIRDPDVCRCMACECGVKATYALYITEDESIAVLPAENAIPDNYFCNKCGWEVIEGNGKTKRGGSPAYSGSRRSLEYRRRKQKRLSLDLAFP